MNTLKVGLLITALTGLFVLVGSWLGGAGGAVVAFVLAALMNLGAYWFSDKMVLKMSGARPLEPGEAPWLESMTRELAARAELPMPKLYLIDDPQPNAFATGRSPEHGVVAVNTGLLQILDREEVAGVVAHELAHIKSRDILTMSVVATLAGAVMMIAQMARFTAIFGGGQDEEGGGSIVGLLVVSLLAPVAAMMVQMGISRAREYEADALGAKIAGTPRGLMRGLDKLHRASSSIPSSMPPQAAHMCIVNPLAGIGGGLLSLFATHPPMEKRIEKLRALEVSL